MSEIDFKKLTEFLDSMVEAGIPSVDCIVCRDHKEIYRHMSGTVDIEKKKPVSSDQRYLMFSMTKVMTMTAVLQLVEKGLLSLDDEVGRFLPAYKNVKVKVKQNDPSDGTVKSDVLVTDLKRPMLIKHLLSMQSGLDYNLERGGINRILKEKGKNATTRELVDSFVESPLHTA